MLRPQAFFGLSLLVTTFALPACGGKSFGAADDNGGNDSGGSDSGGKAHGGSSRGGSAQGGRNSSAGEGGSAGLGKGGSAQGGTAQCDAYLDEGPGNIPVRIVNETKAAIYLGPQPGCGAAPLFSVADAAGTPLPFVGFCQTTCQQLLRGGAISCPAIACPAGQVLTLQPGEDTLQLWNGLYNQPMLFAPACRPATGESMCLRVAAVKPGTFTFMATAGSMLDCSQPYCMTCTPSDTGGCTTFGGVVTGPTLSAQTTLLLDGSYGLGGPGGGGTVQSVEIVFKD
jgi:hypothetical protein